MKIKNLTLLVLFLILISCKNTSEKPENKTDKKIEVADTSETEIEQEEISEEEKQFIKRIDSIKQSRVFSPRGMKMHVIDPYFTEKDLFGFYGKERLEETAVYNIEGMDVMGTEIIFDNPVDNFTIEWSKDDGLESTPRTVRINNNKATWKTAEGIGMGSTIEEVEAANGNPFTIYGFEINDYISGMSKNWGYDGRLNQSSLRFAPSKNIDPEIYDQLKGKNGILSNDPLLKEAGLVVDFIAVHFQECERGKYGTEFCISQLDFLPPEPKENLRGEGWIKVDLWKNTEPAEVYFVQRSTLYDYGSHVIQQYAEGYPDGWETIFNFYNRVTQKKFQLLFSDENHFFKGLINDLVIIDFGTGSSREFMLYDIATGKLVFKGGYYDSISIKGDEIIYEDYLTLTEDQKPECPQELLEKYADFIGYVEIQTYNTKTQVYTGTEVYKCRYME